MVQEPATIIPAAKVLPSAHRLGSARQESNRLLLYGSQSELFSVQCSTKLALLPTAGQLSGWPGNLTNGGSHSLAIWKLFLTMIIDSQRSDQHPKPPGQSMDRPQLSKMISLAEAALISLVKFAHDLIPKTPLYLDTKDAPFPRRSFDSMHPLLNHGFKLYPRNCCTLDAANQSRFWKQGLESSMKLLKLLSDDHATKTLVVHGGITMAGLSRGKLRTEFEHRFGKATSHMYSYADEERTKLLAASMVMTFL